MTTVMISPEEEKRLKEMGFIRNKGTDCFSARVITGNGRVSADTLRHIAKAAELFGDEHVVSTTRLSIEIPGIPYEKTEEFLSFLADGGLETGGTGSRVRPIVCCKGTTCRFGLLDSYSIAEEMHERFYKGYRHVALPHKFKIAVGGCPNNCVKPDLNDVGIIGWRGGYRMMIGGRWGRNHATARPLDHIFTDREEMMRAVEKAILLFKEQGMKGERFCATIERIGFEQVQTQILSDDLLERREAILNAR